MTQKVCLLQEMCGEKELADMRKLLGKFDRFLDAALALGCSDTGFKLARGDFAVCATERFDACHTVFKGGAGGAGIKNDHRETFLVLRGEPFVKRI